MQHLRELVSSVTRAAAAVAASGAVLSWKLLMILLTPIPYRWVRQPTKQGSVSCLRMVPDRLSTERGPARLAPP